MNRPQRSMASGLHVWQVDRSSGLCAHKGHAILWVHYFEKSVNKASCLACVCRVCATTMKGTGNLKIPVAKWN